MIGTIERMFQRYGEFVGRRWYIVTLVSFVFALACGAAVSTMYEEKSDGFDLWCGNVAKNYLLINSRSPKSQQEKL